MVTYNSADAVSRSLPAITSELRPGDELIVCDNGSADGTAERVRELAPAATVVEVGGNPGFGAACNAGADRARNPLLLFLNPDAVALRDVLTCRQGYRSVRSCLQGTNNRNLYVLLMIRTSETERQANCPDVARLHPLWAIANTLLATEKSKPPAAAANCRHRSSALAAKPAVRLGLSP